MSVQPTHPRMRRYWTTLPATAGDQRFSAVLPGAQGMLTCFQARHGRSGTKAVNDLELVPTEANGNTFLLRHTATLRFEVAN